MLDIFYFLFEAPFFLIFSHDARIASSNYKEICSQIESIKYQINYEHLLKIKNMEQNILTFNDPVFGDVRTMDRNGEIWFVGKDVATALGYSLPQKAISEHVEKEDRNILIYKAFSKTEKAKLWKGKDFSNKVIINESGIYALIFSSKLPQAKAFKRWVTSVVLPQIRKTGGYIPVGQYEEEKDVIRRAIDILNRTITQQEILIEEQKPLVQFANAVSGSEESIGITEMAKLLCQNGYTTGRLRFFTWLREHGYIFQRSTAPIQKWVEKGIFDTKETIFQTKRGDEISITTMVTGKGQKYFVDMLCKNLLSQPKARKGKVSLYN